jgi:cysteine-rich repeat protein
MVAVFTASACGSSSDSYSIVMVTVTAPPSLPTVVQLRADITNAGKSETEFFPQGQPTSALTFDARFALALPTSRTGQLDLTVSAFDSAGRAVAAGSGSTPIVVGGRAEVTIRLALPGESDAGTIDSGMGDAGPEVWRDSDQSDNRPLGDVAVDSPWGQDGVSYDGGADVPSVGGAGGAGGIGGHGGAGGVGGSDAGAGGSGGVVVYDGGLDLGGLGGGIVSTGGVGGRDAGPDVTSSGGTGGIAITGGATGTGGILATGGATGTGGATASTDAGLDGPANACSTTVPCPSYPNCQGQPTCDTATGLCSAPSQCSVCGNGALEFSEQCDDGNTVSGDHCSSTCKTEYCGDGIVQGQALASLALLYLARSCGVAVQQPIWLVLNGTEVFRGMVKQTCDCEPGIVTVPVTNPTFLLLGKNGSNVIEVHTAAEISWAVAHYDSPSGPGDVTLVDYGSNGAAQFRRPNLCTNGVFEGREVASTMTLAGAEQCDHGNSNGVGTDTCAANCTVRSAR